MRQPVKLLLVFVFIAVFAFPVGCSHNTSTNHPLNASPVLTTQFHTVVKDGVEVLCPDGWNPTHDDSLVYMVSLLQTIRITVGVTVAMPMSYYDHLVINGNVIRTLVAGYPTYKNNYTYPYGNSQLTTECVTIVNGNKACHFMFLCDTSLLNVYEPVFNHILDNVRFP